MGLEAVLGSDYLAKSEAREAKAMDKVKATVRRIKGRIKRIARWCGEREPGMVIRVKKDGEVGWDYLAPLLEA